MKWTSSLRRKIRILMFRYIHCVCVLLWHLYAHTMIGMLWMLRYYGLFEMRSDTADANLHINWSKNRDKTPKTRQNHYHLLRCSVISVSKFLPVLPLSISLSFSLVLSFSPSFCALQIYNFIHSILMLSHTTFAEPKPHKSFHFICYRVLLFCSFDF